MSAPEVSGDTAVHVRVPAKVNLHLGVGPVATGRLPRAAHRLPGARPHRRGDRAPVRRAARHRQRRRSRGRARGRGQPGLACGRGARRPRRGVAAACTSRSSSRSRWPAAWPADRPTRPARCWPAPSCGRSRRPAAELLELAADDRQRRRLRAGRRHGAGHRAGRAAGARPRDRDLLVDDRHRRLRAVDARGLRRVRPAQRPAAGTDARPTACSTRCAAATCGRWPRRCSNDLQAAALSLAPSLRRTLAAGRELGALAGIVSGSGPTCAFLVEDQPAAVRLAAALTAEGVCRTTRVASGPAPGARLVH